MVGPTGHHGCIGCQDVPRRANRGSGQRASGQLGGRVLGGVGTSSSHATRNCAASLACLCADSRAAWGRKERQCFSLACSGNTRQRQCHTSSPDQSSSALRPSTWWLRDTTAAIDERECVSAGERSMAPAHEGVCRCGLLDGHVSLWQRGGGSGEAGSGQRAVGRRAGGRRALP